MVLLAASAQPYRACPGRRLHILLPSRRHRRIGGSNTDLQAVIPLTLKAQRGMRTQLAVYTTQGNRQLQTGRPASVVPHPSSMGLTSAPSGDGQSHALLRSPITSRLRSLQVPTGSWSWTTLSKTSYATTKWYTLCTTEH